MTQTKNGQLTTYVYNTRDQLTSETSPTGTTTYTYDTAGRQIEKTDSSGSTTYTWIDNDRLSTVNGDQSTVNYTYDPEGRKVGEMGDNGEIRFLIDSQLPYGQVIAETDEQGNAIATYTYGQERISQKRGETVSFYLADGQGSIRQLVDLNGTITDNYTYYAFGEELSHTGTTENSFRYVGEQYDPNSGFYYLRARWMDPANGRFVSVDPWAGETFEPISLHKYLHANANPVMNVDPSGKQYLAEQAAVFPIQTTLMLAYLSSLTISKVIEHIDFHEGDGNDIVYRGLGPDEGSPLAIKLRGIFAKGFNLCDQSDHIERVVKDDTAWISASRRRERAAIYAYQWIAVIDLEEIPRFMVFDTTLEHNLATLREDAQKRAKRDQEVLILFYINPRAIVDVEPK